MRASFPTEFDAMFLGKSREAGSFDTPDGEEVKFGDAYDFSFESSDGLAQTCRIGIKQLDKASEVDFSSLERFTAVHIVADVQVSDRGGFLRPTTVTAL
jgi:hypothetical protein